MRVTKTLKRLASPPARRAASRGDALRDQRDWAEAAAAYAEAVALDPERDAIWVQYGHALKESGRLEEAIQAYRRALALDDANADSHLQLGHALKLDRQLGDAAESYMRAFELDPSMTHAFRELRDLALRGAPVPADRLEAVMARLADAAAAPAPAASSTPPASDLATALERLGSATASTADRLLLEQAAARVRALRATTGETRDSGAPDPVSPTSMLFDASDLMHHFRHSRLPTGIQRVQIEIIRAALEADPASVQICAMQDARWVAIPRRLFETLVDLAGDAGEMGDAAWQAATGRLEMALASDTAFAFPVGGWLINLGTSWHPNYLLGVRNAKRDYGIRFVPFVHDLIPVCRPQYVLPDVTRDYVAWLPSVLDHADFFLVNSNATRRDLIAAAERLDHVLAQEAVVVVPLDARFRTPKLAPQRARDFLRRQRLLGQPFVLFVATLEPRKNHVGALRAWAALLDELGSRMPRLVCVGGRGWMNDEISRLVALDERLARNVLFLHGLSDGELGACYDACQFTLFPSHYEGWGLPITESLCHGKVPVLADNSALPEAGGAFAVYFRSGSEEALVDAVRGLIVDPDRRTALEHAIATGFAPRPWSALAEQIRAAVVARSMAHARPARTGLHRLRLGGYYSFSRNIARRLRPDFLPGYALRAGSDWHVPEDWGSWSGGPSIDLAFERPGAMPVRAFIGVRALPGDASTITVAIDGRDVLEVLVPGSETRWMPVLVRSTGATVHIEVRSDRVVQLAEMTSGADNRTVCLGMLGFYACAADDLAGRLAFVEALATGVLVPGMLDGPSATMPIPPDDGIASEPRPAPALAPASAAAVDTAPPPQPDMEAPGHRTRLDEHPILANATSGEILLLQSSDAEVYAPMLAQSARTTQLYAERHGLLYRSFLGIKRGCLPWHASYNRIDLLMDLIRSDFQGWVFYLDADAWIADLDFDLRAYLADKQHRALIAAPAGHYRDQFWNVNNGVVLFNLGHPFARALIVEWERFLSRHDLAAEGKTWNVEVVDDQGMFHRILDKLPYAADHIHIENKELLNSPWARFARHAIRAEHQDFEARLALVTAEVDTALARLDVEQQADASMPALA